MKKKWAGVLTMMLTILVLVSTAVPVLAQSEGEAPGGTSPIFRAGLAIVAPGVAPVGEEVSMTVFDRQNQLPVKDAGIWALTQENAEILKVEIDRLRGESAASIQELDWESLVSGYGFFLGMTQGNGQLKYTFAEEGGYVLIAIKQGYYPGRTFIAIRTIPVALEIQAPKRASSGEEVTMTVLQKGTGEPVKDAGVWAITRENAEILKVEIDRLREENATSIQELDWESLASVYGFFLGVTHGNGQLKYAFVDEGGYLLLAIKPGYIPGRTFIAIRNIPDALTVQAPNWALVNEVFTITVLQRGTGEPVKDAGVWAITRDNAEVFRAEIARLKEESAGSGQELNIEPLVNVYGFFLGTTHGNGQLNCAFSEAGWYLLVAVKGGCIPGGTGIAIMPPRTDEPANSQQSMQ